MKPVLFLAPILILFVDAGKLCLPDAVPEEQRVYLQTDAGEDIPVGLFMSNWAASFLLTEIVAVLVEEVLGYHVQIEPTLGSHGASTLYALAGCLNPNGPIEEKQCGKNETRAHAAVEVWIGTYASDLTYMEENYPSINPEDLGSMGFRGEESMFLTRQVLEAGLDAEGLALNFYRSYNTSHHNPKQYFGSVSDVDVSILRPCRSGTHFTVAQYMNDYLTWTGDLGGLVAVNGSWQARCVGADGHPAPGGGWWWTSPSCRHDITKCIPVLTVRNGWLTQSLMQWSTAYGLPTAVGVIEEFTDQIAVVQRARNVLFYWWVPDVMFVDLEPESLIFPRFSATEWANGNKRTQADGTYISKMTSANLRQKAPNLREFVSQISLELRQVMEMLLDVNHLPLNVSQMNLWEDAACRWIRKEENRRDLWSKWIPVDTNCFVGYGLVDSEGVFVDARDTAVRCEICPAGAFSEEFSDEQGGKTRRCTLCPAGQSQANIFSSRCDMCQPGSVAANSGSFACSLCAVGWYQSGVGFTECSPCPDDRTTLLLGATSLEDCVCKAEYIEDNKTCVACGEGLKCPAGSTRQQLLQGSGQKPEVLPDYFSWPSDPLRVYHCPDAYCPGGLPGTCEGGRLGPTCAECPSGTYSSTDGCVSCGISMVVAWLTGITVLILAMICSYYFLAEVYSGRATLQECAKIGVDMMLAFMQNLGVLTAVQVPWPEGLRRLFEFSSIFIMNLQQLGFNCAAGGQTQQYFGSVGFFIAVIAGFPLLGKLSNVSCLRVRGLAWKFNRTIGLMGSFLQVVFTTMCNIALVPFMCFLHPNGQLSVLKYPNIFCSSAEHFTMQMGGALVILLGLSHFTLCLWGAYLAPKWSAESPEKLLRLHFLMANYRPSAWWFGLVPLLRGPLLSLPSVVATNQPGLNLTLMLCVILVSFSCQLWVLPWKAPVLNLVDCISTALFLALLAISLHLEPLLAESVATLEAMGMATWYLSVFLIACVFFLSLLFLALQRCCGSKGELRIVNLGRLPDPAALIDELIAISGALDEKSEKLERLAKSISKKMSPFDLITVSKAIDILSTDCQLGTMKGSGRIAARSVRSKRISRFSYLDDQPTEPMEVDVEDLSNAVKEEPDPMQAFEF